MLLLQLESGKENWAYSVKRMLTTHGFGIVWMCQGVGHEHGFISEFKNRLIDSYKQEWHATMEESDKYNWFFSFKNIFQTEKYIRIISNKWHRSNLVRFRVRSLGLNATKRWFQTNTLAQTACPMCGSQFEDEIHFLFVCKSYDDIRQKCIIFNDETLERRDITRVLETENETQLKSLAKFIALA